MKINIIKILGINSIICSFFTVCYIQSVEADNIYPMLSKKTDNFYCHEALKIAKNMFLSDSFNIYTISYIPNSVSSELVIECGEQDHEDRFENDLIIKQDIFEKISRNLVEGASSPQDKIYWQRNAHQGFRLVLESSWFREGFIYTLFTVKEEITANELLSGPNIQPSEQVIEITDGRRPPLILKDNNTNVIWAIGLNSSYDVLGNWKVFSIGDTGVQQCCTIYFRPQVEEVQKLLPPAVTKLSQLLYKTLGRDVLASTYIGDHRRLNEVENAWTNVALRPWSLTIEPYNSRKEVDIGLQRWAQQSKFNHRIYQDILRQYKKTQLSLARYYKMYFNVALNIAITMASHSLDIVFRQYFIFSKNRLKEGSI